MMFKKMFKKKKKKNFSEITDGTISSTALFSVKEAYKTIRTNLILNLDDKPCHVFAITSSQTHEGKTTSSINLSIALAQCDKKVLMIDCDLRRKNATKYLGYSGTLGLSDVVRGKNHHGEVIIETQYPGFAFLSAGTTVSNPAEVLASRAMENFLELAKKDYDFIILDTPPINIVSDALPLISISEGAIIVARRDITTTIELKKLFSSLGIIQANVVGMIYIGSDGISAPYEKYLRYDEM